MDEIKSYSEEIKEYKLKILEVTTLEKDANKLANKLFNERNILVGKLFDNTSILKDSFWIYRSNHYSLNYAGDMKSPLVSFLRELGESDVFFTTFHKSELFLSPEEMYFSFDNEDDIPDFIVKYKLKIDGSSVIGKMRELKKELGNLVALCHRLGIRE